MGDRSEGKMDQGKGQEIGNERHNKNNKICQHFQFLSSCLKTHPGPMQG